MRIIPPLLFFLSLLPLAAHAQAPVVVEMFTSQGCSSCPPAEEYLEELNRQENIIALGCHVDYWDYLQWQDTYSRSFCTARQKDYRTAMGTKHIYTPQIVVNGLQGLNGTDRDAVGQAITETAVAPAKPIALSVSGTNLHIVLPDTEEGAASLYLFQYGDSQDIPIPAGENRGRKVKNVNPVLILKPLGAWDGHAKTIDITLDFQSSGIAVVANKDTLGPVIAAGRIDQK